MHCGSCVNKKDVTSNRKTEKPKDNNCAPVYAVIGRQ